MTAYRALTAAGMTTRDAADLTGVARATAGRAATPTARRSSPRPAPTNRLSPAERIEVLAVLNSAEFVDRTPLQIYAVLLERGTYLCSVSSMYRILAEHAQVKDRRRLARHPARARPELVATGPGQVFSWDITKLRGPVKGSYYDAYVMIDIYSRYIVGACVHVTESAVLAEEMMQKVFTVHGIPRVVHADRGTSMTSKTVAALLTDLGVVRSHSRPRVSNDNPFSEAWFKTLKYAPVFPTGSAHCSTPAASSTCSWRTTTTNTASGLHAPADVHYHLAEATTERRTQKPGVSPKMKEPPREALSPPSALRITSSSSSRAD